MRNPISAVLFGLFLLFGSVAAQAADAMGHHKVVVQVSDSDQSKWGLALNNIQNMQTALGKDKVTIELVAYGPGIGMLQMDSKVADRIATALKNGVAIKACQNTMRAKHLTKEDMLSDISYAPSGVVEVMERQEDGYAYIRP